MSPCPTFYNTFELWRNRIEDLPEEHDPTDRTQATAQAFRNDAIPVGLFYKEVRPTLDSHTQVTNHPFKPGARDFDVQSLLEIYR
jgi:2-oxoglutarate ferredoxin oxidoreductase subunit beta